MVRLNKMIVVSALALTGAAFSAEPASRDAEAYAVQPGLDFGAWCLDVAHHDADRCSEDRPDDKAAYESYRSSTKSFEQEILDRKAARAASAERIRRMGDVTPGNGPQ
jgi:hypothetical protein